ncbi:MAG: hypothetical protein QXV77_00880 [Candidatus Bathyarchaeia archaeon]
MNKPRPRPQERIREYFLSRGYSEDPPDDGGLPSFSDGIYRTAVKTLSLEDLEDRNMLLQSLLEAASKSGSHDKTYVAMPKLLASVIDGKTLKEAGLGLLIYDERSVEEAIPARTNPRRIQAEPTSMDPSMTRELQILKAEISELKETVEKLKRELNTLKGSVKPLEGKIKEVEMRPEAPPPSPSSGLPSFFQDNPWLSVLSQRGREDDKIAS